MAVQDVSAAVRIVNLEEIINDIYLAIRGPGKPDDGHDLASGLFAIADALHGVAEAIRDSKK